MPTGGAAPAGVVGISNTNIDALLMNLETQNINQSGTNSLAWAASSHHRLLKKAKDQCEAPQLTEETAMAYHFPGQDCDAFDFDDTCEHGIRHIGDDLYDMSMARPAVVPPVPNNCCRFYSETYLEGTFEDFCTNS